MIGGKPRKSGWTPERRAKQSAAIRIWSPWSKTTGPKSPEGKAVVARNAFKGAKRIKHRAHIKKLRAEADEICALISLIKNEVDNVKN